MSSVISDCNQLTGGLFSLFLYSFDFTLPLNGIRRPGGATTRNVLELKNQIDPLLCFIWSDSHFIVTSRF